jgi:hypothetical protein
VRLTRSGRRARSSVDPVKLCEPPGDGEGEEGNDQPQQECGQQGKPQLGDVRIPQRYTTLDTDTQQEIDRDGLVEGFGEPQVTLDGNGEKAERKGQNGGRNKICQRDGEYLVSPHVDLLVVRSPDGIGERPFSRGYVSAGNNLAGQTKFIAHRLSWPHVVMMQRHGRPPSPPIFWLPHPGSPSNSQCCIDFLSLRHGEEYPMSFRIREYHPADTDAVLELWESAKSHGFEPVYGLAEVLASCQKDHAVVALSRTAELWALLWPGSSRARMDCFLLDPF